MAIATHIGLRNLARGLGVKRAELMRTAVLMLVALACVTIPARPAFACSCAVGTTEQAYTYADAVFLGRLVTLEEPRSYEAPITHMVTFQVDKVWKGAPIASVRVAWWFDLPGMCGDVPLKDGQSYVIYAERERVRFNGRSSSALTVHPDCGPSHEVMSSVWWARELDELNRLMRRH